MKTQINTVFIGLGLAVAAILVLSVKKNGLSNLGAAAGGAAVDLVDGAATGIVKGVGGLIGIPDTNETECEKAMREGRTWDASFACPAGTFIRYVATPTRTSDSAAIESTAFTGGATGTW